jgi:uncharacterized protein (TIGR02466 family)
VDLNCKTTTLFPICLHTLVVDNFDQLQTTLIKESYDLKNIDSKGRKISNVGGWQSEISSLDKSSHTLKSIMTKLLKDFAPMQKDVLMYIEGWTNINGPGCHNVKHHHPQCNLAGVFWIKVPSKSGNLLFESPYSFTSFTEVNCYTDKFRKNTNSYLTYSYRPTEGQIVIFPSFLPHSVLKNESNEDRISYSFNIKLNYD